MKIRHLFFIFNFIFVLSLYSQDSFWEGDRARGYFHNSELQRQWSLKLLVKVALPLDAKVLDFGCGDGKISAHLSYLVPKGSVIAIDASEGMIDFASAQFLDIDNLHFKCQDLMTWDTDKRFDAIFSFCAIHLTEDIPATLKKLASLLKPGGTLYFQIPAKGNPSFGKAFYQLAKNSSWAPFFEGYDWPIGFIPVEECASMLQDAGLNPVRIEKRETLDPFYDKKEFIQWGKNTLLPVGQIPSELQDAFMSDWIDAYLEIEPEGQAIGGPLFAHWNCLEVEAANSLLDLQVAK